MNEDRALLARDVVASALDLSLPPGNCRVGTWGQADYCWEVAADTRIFLEVEHQQTHPDTNVLKFWPFLDENPALSIVLVHAFFPDSRSWGGSRARLARWLGNKMHRAFSGRFNYGQVLADPVSRTVQNIAAIRSALSAMTHAAQPGVAADAPQAARR
jgi:hypothetical protein